MTSSLPNHRLRSFGVSADLKPDERSEVGMTDSMEKCKNKSNGDKSTISKWDHAITNKLLRQ
jgi:hypothetical protein